jgi:hypothetical protein
MQESKDKREKATKSLKDVVFRGTNGGSGQGESDEIKELE